MLISRHALGQAGNRPPNIILVLVDDMGWRELNCYGNTFNETPNLDRLAAQGMRFTDAYAAAPVCSPTRASVMTGQYPAHVGITDYLRADDEKYLDPERYASVARLLKDRGYATALVGKWHLMGDYATRKGDPKLHGFDEAICTETTYIGGGDYFHPYKHLPGVEARLESEYLTDRLGLEACDFVRRHRDEPFFLYLCTFSVHTALSAKEEVIAKYKAKPGVGKDKNNPVLAAMIECIDDNVGKLMATLDELGLADDTLLVFMSDNGGEHKVTSNAPLRGAKSQVYEGGIREPMIVRWPKVVPKGTECSVPVTTADFFPTFLDAVGAAPKAGQAVDGESLVPLLRGGNKLSRDAIFWHYPLEKPHFLGGRSGGAVREGDLKLIEFYDTGEIELYNLREDIGETKNLAEAQPEVAARLRKRLAEWRTAVGAKMTP